MRISELCAGVLEAAYLDDTRLTELLSEKIFRFREDFAAREHPISNIQQPTSNNQHPTSDIRHPTSDIRHPTTNIQQPTTNIRHPTSDIQHPTSNIRHPTTNSTVSPGSVIEPPA
jgi:hypothetical protein